MKPAVIISLLLFLTLSIGVYAQPAGYVSIRTSESDLIALVDSNKVVQLPVDTLRLAAGIHTIRIQHGSEWNGVVLDTSLAITADSKSELMIPARYTYTILSEPGGASVAVKERTLGVTPLTVTTDRPLSLPIALSLSHFETVMIDPPLQPLTRARLFPDGTSEPIRVFDRPHSLRNYGGWVYGSIATGIVCGTASVLAKTRADRYNDDFLMTGNLSHRDKAKTLDLVAASTLLITEISFGVLSYLLLTQ